MSGYLVMALVVPVIAYLLLAEIIARRTERRYRTDIDPVSHAGFLTSPSVGSSGQAASADEPHEPLGDRPWKGWRKVVVASIHDESNDCRSFKLQPFDNDPTCSSGLPDFLGGQSIAVRIPSDSGQPSPARCYSLSGGPGESGYRITVRRIPGGRLSTRLHDSVDVGDVLEIQAPRGRFHMNTQHVDRPMHLIAAGIGITPLLSMVLHSMEATPDRPVHLYYQLQNSDNAPFLSALLNLHHALSPVGRFQLRVWFSRMSEDANSSFKKQLESFVAGRVSADQIFAGAAKATDDFRICGPNQFMESLSNQLIQCGADPKNVQYETFGGKSKASGAVADGKQGSESDEPEIASAVSAAPCSGEGRVVFASSGVQSDNMEAWESLLELAEASKVMVESACRTGSCGTCVCRLIRGKVNYPEKPEYECNSDEVVMCLAKPDGDVEIEA
jgi:ferredoxin-NADP reductase